MSIVNPLPFYCIALLLLLPGGYLLFYRISRKIISGKISQRVVAAGIFLASWLIFLTYTGLFLRSFVAGLMIATILLGLLGYMYELVYFRNKKFLQNETKPLSVEVADRWMWSSALITSAVIFLIGTYGSFHDEKLINGHKTIIAQIQNDFFPPRNILNPGEALRYHFGFDTICAAMTALTRCSVDFAIDFVTAVSWFFCWVGLWLLGKRLFSYVNSGFAVAAMALLGGGLIPLLGMLHPNVTWDEGFVGFFSIRLEYPVNPPLFSYFFQHPFGAGLPLTICILLLLSEVSKNKILLRNIIISLLLTALYFCQTVLFLTLFPVLFLYLVRYRKQYHFIPLTALIVLIIVISKSGLLFTPISTEISREVILSFWPSHQPLGWIIVWYTASFGLLLIFGVIGFFWLKKLRPLFAYIIIVTLGIPMVFRYIHTWDIVKFSTVCSFYLGILSGGAVAWMLESNARSMRRLAYIGIAGLTFSSVLYGVAIFYSQHFKKAWPDGVVATFNQYTPELTGEHIDVINWFRTNGKMDEMVFCDEGFAEPFGIYSGMPTLFDEDYSRAHAFGMNEERRKRFKEIFETKTLTESDFQNFNINRIIYSETDSINYGTALTSGNFIEEKHFGKLIVYRRVHVD